MSDNTMCSMCFESGHSNVDCKENFERLAMVGSIAAMIASRLNFVLPECNSAKRGGKPTSTIKVEQYKEKFKFVVVYCELANAHLVDNAWIDHHGPSCVAPPSDFVRKCLHNDAFHYRRCYLDMVKLVPDMKRRIVHRADFTELLFDTVEQLDAYLACFNDLGKAALIRSYNGIETFNELSNFLHVVYSTNEFHGARLV